MTLNTKILTPTQIINHTALMDGSKAIRLIFLKKFLSQHFFMWTLSLSRGRPGQRYCICIVFTQKEHDLHYVKGQYGSVMEPQRLTAV